MPDAMTWEEWEGRTILGRDGQRVGRISQVYLDHETGAPTWGAVHTGLFGAGHAFVPLQGGRWQGDAYEVPYPAQLCKSAPHFSEDQELTHADQRRLIDHYAEAEAADGTATTGDRPGSPQTGQSGSSPDAPHVSNADASMVRSEERAAVRVTRTPGESVRLRKTVVTEPVSRTVTVRREELRIEREPITVDTNAGFAGSIQLREEVHHITLMHEEPVLEKTVVPVERVRLNRQVREDQQEVAGELRKERIELS